MISGRPLTAREVGAGPGVAGALRGVSALGTPATFGIIVAAVGAVVAYALLLRVGQHMARVDGWGVIAELTLLAVLAQLYPIKFAPKRVTTAALGAAFALVLVADDRVAIPLVVASQVAGQAMLMAQGKRGLVSVVFNPLQTGIAAAACAATLRVTPWGWLAPIAGGVVMYAVSALLVAAFTVVRNGVPWRRALLAGRRESMEHGAGTLFVGWLVVASLHQPALVPLAMVLPVAALTLATTRLHHLQAQAAVLEHAEAQARARRELLQVAAHELRTPITSLRGYADFFSRKLSAGVDIPPDMLRRAMATIDGQSGRLARLIDQLLDFTRLESGRLVLKRERVDLATLARSVVEEVRGVTPGALFLMNAPPALPADVDPLRVEQVLVNLLTNAAKFSPEGSPIEITARGQGQDAFLEVRDYGAGVPEDQREAIFQPFVQAHGDGAVGGLGLGLYVTREIVEAHGGTVRVEPTGDRGSRFVVRLPGVMVRSDTPADAATPTSAAA